MDNLIDWSEDFGICDTIDAQHKKLVELINNLYQAFVDAKVKDAILPIIKKLKGYTIYHFGEEERMFAENNYSFSDEHLSEHQEFVKNIEDFASRYAAGDSLLPYDVMTFLKDWLLNHILVSDKKYIEELCPKK
jgi:hemerythrin